jgi:predicted nucleotidyltransferase
MNNAETYEAIPATAASAIRIFVHHIHTAFPDEVIGIYVIGSVALDDFQECKSDIDLLVLCRNLHDEDRFSTVRIQHRLISRKAKLQLNGYYITADALNVANAANTKAIYFQGSHVEVRLFDMAIVTLLELHNSALTVYGAPSNSLSIRVNKDDVTAFTFSNLIQYWQPWLKKHNSLWWRKISLVIIPRVTEWTLLGLARQLYTLYTGEITSKTNAGKFCIKYLPADLREIMLKAIDIRLDNNPHLLKLGNNYIAPSIKRAKKTTDCAAYLFKMIKENCITRGS